MHRMSKFTFPAIRDRLADWRNSYALVTSFAETVPLRRDMLTLLTFVRENDVLAEFGALECRYRSDNLAGMRIDKLTTIQITPLGRALLEAIALADE
jgi:hypothetical protein